MFPTLIPLGEAAKQIRLDGMAFRAHKHPGLGDKEYNEAIANIDKEVARLKKEYPNKFKKEYVITAPAQPVATKGSNIPTTPTVHLILTKGDLQ